MKLLLATEKLCTGPIDDLTVYDTAVDCPKCEHEYLQYLPQQSGPCHSGLFNNSCKQHYHCPECVTDFIDEDPCNVIEGDDIHDWEYKSDWYGDAGVINGTADCGHYVCNTCGAEDHETEPPSYDYDMDSA